MYPYNGRPTEEFLRDYNLKLRELQELIESQGMNLQIKPGGRCVVVPATSKDTETIDKSHLISYSQQYNANTIDSEDTETTEAVYETYEDYLDFERKLALIHEAKDSDIVVDFSAEFLDLAPIIEEKLMFKEEAQLYGRFCQEVIRILNGASSKTIAWKQITKDYNNSKLVAELRYKKGPVIDLRGYIYVVISRQNVPKIGRKVQKGILGQLRSLSKVGCYRLLE